MNENDYIAEYIKEKYPTLLGVDFVFWKFGKQMTNLAHSIADAFNNMPAEYFEGVMSKDVETEYDSKSSDG